MDPSRQASKEVEATAALIGGRVAARRSCDYGTYKTVKAKCWPWLYVEVPKTLVPLHPTAGCEVTLGPPRQASKEVEATAAQWGKERGGSRPSTGGGGGAPPGGGVSGAAVNPCPLNPNLLSQSRKPWRKPKPESGLDWHSFSKFTPQRLIPTIVVIDS